MELKQIEPRTVILSGIKPDVVAQTAKDSIPSKRILKSQNDADDVYEKFATLRREVPSETISKDIHMLILTLIIS